MSEEKFDVEERKNMLKAGLIKDEEEVSQPVQVVKNNRKIKEETKVTKDPQERFGMSVGSQNKRRVKNNNVLPNVDSISSRRRGVQKIWEDSPSNVIGGTNNSDVNRIRAEKKN